jgi:sortase A
MSQKDEAGAPTRGVMRGLERLLLAVGMGLLIVYAAARFHGEAGKAASLARFEANRAAVATVALKLKESPASLFVSPAVDDSLWSEKRIRAYRDSLALQLDAPIAVLRIPKLRLEVPVLDGTDDLTLNRGVGRIDGTARPGESGNLGIAGHRDGFFRGLKDVARGDTITLETLAGPEDYLVEGIRIVNPEDTFVLDPTQAPVLTLVTCYPFYFVGDAPHRYIVQAVRRSASVETKPVPR